MMSESVPQTNFDLGLSELAPLLHIQKLFFINIGGVFCTHKFISTPRHRRSSTSSADVIRLPPPTLFLRREPGDDAKNIFCSITVHFDETQQSCGCHIDEERNFK